MTKGAETKATILEQAISMASVYGLEGLTIGQLAKETRMSKSGLFGHFGSKEALQFSVLDAVIKNFALLVMDPARKELTGNTQLEILFAKWTPLIIWHNTCKGNGKMIRINEIIILDDPTTMYNIFSTNAKPAPEAKLIDIILSGSAM